MLKVLLCFFMLHLWVFPRREHIWGRCRGRRGTGWNRRPLELGPSTLGLAPQGQPGKDGSDQDGGGVCSGVILPGWVVAGTRRSGPKKKIWRQSTMRRIYRGLSPWWIGDGEILFSVLWQLFNCNLPSGCRYICTCRNRRLQKPKSCQRYPWIKQTLKQVLY